MLKVINLFLLANLITIWMQRLIKKRHPLIARIRIRIYLIPFLFSYYVGDFTTFWITVIAMIGVEITTNYAKYKLKIN